MTDRCPSCGSRERGVRWCTASRTLGWEHVGPHHVAEDKDCRPCTDTWHDVEDVGEGAHVVEELERERDEARALLLDKGMKVGNAETVRLTASLQEARGLLERIDREDQNMTDATVSGSPDHVFQEAYDMRDEAIKAIRPFLSSTKRENVRQMTDGLLDDRGLCMPHCSNGHHGECSEGDCRCENPTCVAYRREWYEGYSEPSTKETE